MEARVQSLLVTGLSALVHHFTSGLYVGTRIYATSVLMSLSYVSFKLLETRVQAEFSVDTNILAHTHIGKKLHCKILPSIQVLTESSSMRLQKSL